MHEIKVYNFQLTGALKGFPHQVVEKMLQRSVEQHPTRTIKHILSGLQENNMDCFNWRKSIEKYHFWREVILYKRFELFFQKYPKSCGKRNIK